MDQSTTTSIAAIDIDFLDSKTVRLRVTRDQGKETLNEDTFVSDSEDVSLRPLFLWICAGSKKIFFLPPTTEVIVSVNGSVSWPEPLIPHLSRLKRILETTQEHLKRQAYRKGAARAFDGKLFLNLGKTPFLHQFYEKAFEAHPERAFHDACEVVHQKATAPKPTVDSLIEEILEKRIGTIYSHNVSYLAYFVEANDTYLPPLMELLGVEFVVMDFDTYNQMDGHYYHKLFLNDDRSRRFGIMPHIESYWDESLGIRNIRYMSFPHRLKEPAVPTTETPTVPQDYDIVLTTWSRLDHILFYLKPLLLFLDYVDDRRPFYDYQMMFHCMSHLLLRESSLPHYHKTLYYKTLSCLYFQAYSLFKFEILEGLKTHRKILLFGDAVWNDFFPDYYQRELTAGEHEDVRSLHHDKDFMYLLANCNYNYFESNPILIRVMNAGIPYLNTPSVVRLPDMEGLSSLEYGSLEELNRKIDHVPLYAEDSDYLKARARFAHLNNACVDEMFREALEDACDPRLGGPKSVRLFDEISRKHQEDFHAQMLRYLETHMAKIHECMVRLLRRDYHHYAVYDSKYASRAYFQKILRHYEHALPRITELQKAENTL